MRLTTGTRVEMMECGTWRRGTVVVNIECFRHRQLVNLQMDDGSYREGVDPAYLRYVVKEEETT